MTRSRAGWYIWNYEFEEWQAVEEHFTQEEWDEDFRIKKVLEPSHRGETHRDERSSYLLQRRNV